MNQQAQMLLQSQHKEFTEQDLKMSQENEEKNLSILCPRSEHLSSTYQPESVNQREQIDCQAIQTIPFESFLQNLDKYLQQGPKTKRQKNTKSSKKRRKIWNICLHISRSSSPKIPKYLWRRSKIGKKTSFSIHNNLKPLLIPICSFCKLKPLKSSCLNSLKKKRPIN